jgi:hypothetical protein
MPPAKDEDYLSKSLIGGFSCAVASAVLNPFDVTKIRMQNITGFSHEYRNMFVGARTIYREEGFRGWCRGMTPSMFREMSYSSIRMGFYDPIRDALARILNDSDDPKFASPLVKYFAGTVSGGTGAALANPFDLIKTRFQALKPGEVAPYKTMIEAISYIIKHEGISGLYKGWALTCGRAAILTSAQIGTYDSVKNNIFIRNFNIEEGFLLHFFSAMTAAVAAVTACNPLDVAKTRYMADKVGLYRNPLHCLVHIYQVDGAKGFMKGWTPAYLRLGPHSVISFILIEELRTYFGFKTI